MKTDSRGKEFAPLIRPSPGEGASRKLAMATPFARSLAGQLQPGVLDRRADFRTRRPHDLHVAVGMNSVPTRA